MEAVFTVSSFNSLQSCIVLKKLTFKSIETCVMLNVTFLVKRMSASGCWFMVVVAGYIHKVV